MSVSSRLFAGLSAAAISIVCVAGAAAADPAADLKPAIGNTVVSTHPDGRKARLWLSADGSYEAQGRDGGRSGGAWKLKGGKLCLSQRRPMSIPLSYCRAFPHETIGRPWADVAFNGDHVTNEILRGR